MATATLFNYPVALFPGLIPGVPAPESIDAKIGLVLARVDQGVPYVTIQMLVPVLGISENALRKHAQGYNKLKTWKGGNYRFDTDDAEHMKLLVGLLRRVLFSSTSLPDDLRFAAKPTVGRKSQRVH